MSPPLYLYTAIQVDIIIVLDLVDITLNYLMY
jgi:hypothetical protein